MHHTRVCMSILHTWRERDTLLSSLDKQQQTLLNAVIIHLKSYKKTNMKFQNIVWLCAFNTVCRLVKRVKQAELLSR